MCALFAPSSEILQQQYLCVMIFWAVKCADHCSGGTAKLNRSTSGSSEGPMELGEVPLVT